MISLRSRVCPISSRISECDSQREGRASGSAGVPPAVFRILRNTRRTSLDVTHNPTPECARQDARHGRRDARATRGPSLVYACPALWLALMLLPSAISAHAQMLIREVISREVSFHVGGVQTPDIKEVVSREASFFIENGLVDKQVISREVSFVVGTPAVPPQVTGYTVTPSPTGDSVTLNWANYNPWAVGDVDRLEIYISDQPFTDVTNINTAHPYRIGAETVTATFTGLTPLQDHYIAIVAVDVLGNRNTTEALAKPTRSPTRGVIAQRSEGISPACS